VTKVKDLLDAAVFYEPVKPAVDLKPDDIEALQASFRATQFQNVPAVKRLVEELRTNALNWNDSSRYYAPYAALVNASMTGKSRLLTETRKEGVFLFYMCLRKTLALGHWPPRTPAIGNWATAKDANMLDFTVQTCGVLQACLELLCDWLQLQKHGLGLKDLTERWYDYVNEKDVEFWNEVVFRAAQARMPEELMKSLKPTDGEVRRAHNIAQYWRTHQLGSVTIELRKLLQARGIDTAKQLQLLYVVDETKEMNEASGDRDRFAWFRRALTALPYVSDQDPLAFCVVTDTTSRVANLSPSRALDPSFRVRDPLENKDLFPPCTVADTVDAWWHSFNKSGIHIEPDNLAATLATIRSKLNSPAAKPDPTLETLKHRLPMSLLETFEFMSMFGRPAFYAFLHKRGGPFDKTAIKSLVKLLQAKLLRQNPDSPPAASVQEMFPDDEIHELSNTDRGVLTVSSFTQAQALGTLGAIASLDISISSKLASELSAGHMRLLAAISDQRQFVFTLEVSEPALAYAAHRLILSGRLPWFVLIDKLASTLINNCLLAGYQGEVASQILMLMTWQKCARWDIDALQFVPAGEYLELIVKGVLDGRRRQMKQEAELIEHPQARSWLIKCIESNVYGEDESELVLKTMESSVAKRVRGFLSELATLDEQEARFALVKQDLIGVNLRLFQFVKTVANPSRKMLLDYMIRGSGIVCKDYEQGIDFILPTQTEAIAGANSVCAILGQTKIYSDSISDRDMHNFATKIRVAQAKYFPVDQTFVGIVFSLDPTSKRAKRIEILTSEDSGTKHIILVSGFSPSDLFPDDRLVALAFERFLVTKSDPVMSLHVLSSRYANIRRVFATQPYSENHENE
jgi:hypothetical protein